MKESVVRNSQKRSKYPRKNYIKLLLCADDHNGGEGEATLAHNCDTIRQNNVEAASQGQFMFSVSYMWEMW